MTSLNVPNSYQPDSRCFVFHETQKKLSTIIVTAVTATPTVTSADGATSRTLTFSTASTFFKSNPVSSTGTSSTRSATPAAGAAAQDTMFVTFRAQRCFFETHLTSCLMSQTFASSVDFEAYLQQFNTTALLSVRFCLASDNQAHYAALRLRGNDQHFNTTLPAAQHSDFNLLVDDFRQKTQPSAHLESKLESGPTTTKSCVSVLLCHNYALKRRT